MSTESTDPLPVPEVERNCAQRPNEKSVGDNAGEKNQLSRRARKRLKRMQTQAEHATKKPRMKKSVEYHTETAFMDRTKETDYYYENGLRKVYPYVFTFSTFAKQRWFGRKLLEVFCEEFKHFPDGVFKKRLEEGSVSVNGKRVDVDYVIKNGDHLTHASHRHEVPVTAEPIQIVLESDEILVINKPSSIPCHPCGSFRHNSVIFILERQFNKRNLRFVHRLDRLTSGLLLLVKTESKAKEISRQVSGRLVEKEYICRVDGHFPDGVVECDQPMDVMSHKLGIQHITSTGKEAQTTFERISYNGKSSVVKCWPHTGRTHQIRVHLQFLGHPIINDPMYNNDCWGENKGKGAKYGISVEEIIKRLLANHDKLKYVIADISKVDGSLKPGDDDNPQDTISTEIELTNSKHDTVDRIVPPVGIDGKSTSPRSADEDENTGDIPEHVTDTNTEQVSTPNKLLESACMSTDVCEGYPRPGLDPSKLTFDPDCFDCVRKFKDPIPENLVIYLHALRYKGPDWEYSTPLPEWAAEDWRP